MTWYCIKSVLGLFSPEKGLSDALYTVWNILFHSCPGFTSALRTYYLYELEKVSQRFDASL